WTALPWPPPPGRYRPDRPRRTLSIPWSYGRFFLSGSSRHFLTRRQKRIVLLGGPDRDPQMPRDADIPDQHALLNKQLPRGMGIVELAEQNEVRVAVHGPETGVTQCCGHPVTFGCQSRDRTQRFVGM